MFARLSRRRFGWGVNETAGGRGEGFEWMRS